MYLASGRLDEFELKVVGLAVVERAMAAGRGCVMLGSHLGSFDLLMLAHRSMQGRPITVLMQVDPRARLRRIAGFDEDALNIIRVGEPDS